MRNILGDSTPEHIMTNAVIKSEFDFEKAISVILAQQGNPSNKRIKSLIVTIILITKSVYMNSE